MFRKTLNKMLSIIASQYSLAMISFLVYLFTLAPGVYGFDSGELATGVYTLGIVHPPGYPLYMLLGKLFSFLPFGSLPLKLNILSALFASLTVYFLYSVILLITSDRSAAWIGSAFLAFSSYFWQMSVIAEVYTLHTLLLVLCLYFLLRWRKFGNHRNLYIFALLFGLSLCNHTSGIFFAPGYAWMIVSSSYWKWKNIKPYLFMALLFLLGLLPYIYLPLRANSNTQLNYIRDFYNVDLTTLKGIWWMFSGKAYRFFAFGYAPSELFNEFLHSAGYIWRNFLGVGVILGFVGFIRSFRQDWKLAAGLTAVFLGNFIFYFNYRVLDKDTMFLPSFLIWAICIGCSIPFILNLLTGLLNDAIDHNKLKKITVGFWVVLVLFTLGFNWRWVDMSDTLGPTAFSNTVMTNLPQNSTVIARWSPAVVLEYFQIVEKKRPDIKIYNRSRNEVARYYRYWAAGVPKQKIYPLIHEEEILAIDKMFSYGAVFMIEYEPSYESSFEFVQVGSYFQLLKR
jgi:hypothetical protein